MIRKTFYSLIAGVLLIGGIGIILLNFGSQESLASDLTIGYSQIGVSDWQNLGDADTMQCMPATSPVGSYQVDSLGVYMKTGSTYQIKGVIVLAADKTIIANGVGNAVDITSGSGDWVTSTFATPPELASGTSYHLCFVQNGGAQFSIAYDEGDWYSGELLDASNSYTTPTDPTDGSIDSFGGYMSIYASLSEVSAPSGTDYNPNLRRAIIIN